MSDYGKTIKEIRKVYGYTQTQLAKATNIVQQNLSAWENNVNIPNIDFCVRLADFYGISIDELIGREIPPANKENNKQKIPSRHAARVFFCCFNLLS